MKFIIPLWTTPPSHQAGSKRSPRGGYKTHQLSSFQEILAAELKSRIARLVGFTEVLGPYSCSCTFYLKNRKRGDITNIWKTVEDACQGILFPSDANCEELFLWIMYDKKNPRIEILIEPLDNNSEL